MAKDPAVLFYTSDFLSGTSFFSYEEKGRYITLLCQQHQKNGIPENHMINICESLDSQVAKKFVKGEDGLYRNQRMADESERRRNYCNSRSNNKSGRKSTLKDNNHTKITSKSYENRMENENDNEDVSKNGKLKEEQVMDYPTLFTYWEQNKKGGKYKNEQSRLRMMNRLFKLTRNDYDFAKKAIFHCIDSNYQGFCNGDGLYYKEKTEYQLSQEKERSKAKQKTEITGRYIPPAE